MTPHRFDRLLDAMKWPAALGLMLSCGPSLATLGTLGRRAAGQPRPWLALLAGLVLLLLLMALGLGRSRWLRWLYTLEHELTHAALALLTGHPVTRLVVGEGSGELHHEGPGNWLVALGPYFFPTFCLPPMALLSLAQTSARPGLTVALGFGLGLHLHSSWQETHARQPDLQGQSLLLCWCLLPGAYLLGLLAALSSLPGPGGLIWEVWHSHAQQGTRWLLAHWR